MIQKIIRVGNSYGVIIPKEVIKQLRIKEGEKVRLEAYPELSMFAVKQAGATADTKLTPEFKNWLDRFTKKNKKLLLELAHKP